MLIRHVHKTLLRNHKEMGQGKCHTDQSQNQKARSQEERNPVSGANKRDAHSRHKCPVKDATDTFCGEQGHFERAGLQKKGIDESTNLLAKSKHQLAVDVNPDQ